MAGPRSLELVANSELKRKVRPGYSSNSTPSEGGALYGALDAIDRCVEVPPGYLQGRLFGLTDLFLDALLLDRQAGVAADFPAHGAGELLVVAGVRGEFSRGGRRE